MLKTFSFSNGCAVIPGALSTESFGQNIPTGYQAYLKRVQWSWRESAAPVSEFSPHATQQNVSIILRLPKANVTADGTSILAFNNGQQDLFLNGAFTGFIDFDGYLLDREALRQMDVCIQNWSAGVDFECQLFIAITIELISDIDYSEPVCRA